MRLILVYKIDRKDSCIQMEDSLLKELEQERISFSKKMKNFGANEAELYGFKVETTTQNSSIILQISEEIASIYGRFGWIGAYAYWSGEY
jgi:hypothetical protein